MASSERFRAAGRFPASTAGGAYLVGERPPLPRPCLGSLVVASAERRPGALALISRDRTVTYGELVQRADRLAGGLSHAGVRAGDLVAVALPRGVDMVATWLAALLLGAAYMPLDPDDRSSRAARVLAEVGAAALVATEGYEVTAGRLPVTTPARLAALPDGGCRYGGLTAGDRTAYVIATSGSTGRPKYVEVPHSAVGRLVMGSTYCRWGQDRRLLHASAPVFDAATFEVWGALLHGGTCVVDGDPVMSPDGLAATIRAHGVTTAFLTTAQFNLMIDELPDALDPLDELLFGGEAVSRPHVERALELLPSVRLVHMYGPTEVTTFATSYRVTRTGLAASSTVPIGRPISHTTAFVADGDGQAAGDGRGELWLGGRGLATGYRGDPELTRDRFREAGPSGERMYRTGDLVRLVDGQLEFVGRVDDQLKVRGHRIEPAEVEGVLAALPRVRRACVVGERRPDADGYLVAHVVGDVSAEEVVREARAALPGFLVPARVVVHDELPLTPNGKIDRRALRAVATAHVAAPVPTAGDPRAQVAEIWADLLGEQVQRIDPDANFFDVGGTSVTLQRLHARLQRLISASIPVVALLEHTTVRSQAALLASMDTDTDPAPGQAHRRDSPSPSTTPRAPGSAAT